MFLNISINKSFNSSLDIHHVRDYGLDIQLVRALACSQSHASVNQGLAAWNDLIHADVFIM